MTPDKEPSAELFVTGIPFPPREIDDSDLPPIPPEMLAPRELTEEEIEVGRDMEWGYNNPELQQLYPDQIVAIYRRKVVAVGGDWKTVRDEAECVTGAHRNHIALIGVPGPSILEK
jgi:hypothetical protein